LTAFPKVTILGDWYEEGLISDVLFKDDIQLAPFAIRIVFISNSFWLLYRTPIGFLIACVA
jgi:hypothetical protein